MARKRWPPSATLTTAEAAHHVGLAASTLAKMRVYKGGPVWVQLAGAVRYRVADLDAWLMANRTGLEDEQRRESPPARRKRG